MEILVEKRDGSFEKFDANKTNKVIKWACDGVSGVVENEIALAFHTNIKNGISTKEIHKGLIQASVGLISEANPNYEIVSANLLNYELRKEVWKGKDAPDFYRFIVDNIESQRYTSEISKWFSEDEISELGKYIKHDRDFNFKYSGLSQVIDKYLVKKLPEKQMFETPQFAYMLIAMVLFHDEKNLIREAYDSFSNFDISLPTPVFAGVRTNLKSFASCLLMDMGDSVDEICAGFEVIAKATSKRFGIGVNMSKMRPIGAPIRNGENIHTGKVGFLRTIQDTIKTWLQGSTRSGAATVTIPIWDYEIEEILQLKDPMRPPENRVGDIDYLISMSKLFYSRWIKNETVTLFNAHECPELEQNFGLETFDELYIKAEKNPNIKFKKVVNMRDLASLFQKNGIESGRYYIINIDHANSHSSFKERIGMANLCVEVLHPTIPMKYLNDPDGLLGICILLALNNLNLKTDEKHERVCYLAVKILDKLIDYQEYFCLPALNFASKYRSLGIGMTNFAAWLAKKGLKYSSQEAREAANELFEKNQYFLIKASVKLAQEKGPCEWFSKTKYSDGVLPIDTYKKSVDTIVSPELKMDWESLRKDVLKYGMRHSTLSAFMPCESSALVTNSTNGIERPRSKFVSKGNKSKDLPVITPNFKKWTYEYAFENETNEDHIKMMAILQKYCDMSISANFYYNYGKFEDGQIPAKILDKDITDAYKFGLKTIYYRNSEDGNNHNLNNEQQESCSGGACSI